MNSYPDEAGFISGEEERRLRRLVNAVFEGGGVKGIALAGAVCFLEQLGYGWRNLAGTSAGASDRGCALLSSRRSAPVC